VVPRILSFDDARGEIVFERLPLVSFREALARPDPSRDLASLAARALAAIHREMPVVDESGSGAATPPDRHAGRQVALHGDYGMRNLFVLGDAGTLAIIDWSNADWTGVVETAGLPEVDVAVFLMSLFHRRAFGPHPLPQRREVARRFLTAYAAEAPRSLDLDRLVSVVGATTPGFQLKIRRRLGAVRALSYWHNLVDLRLFLRGVRRRGLAPALAGR